MADYMLYLGTSAGPQPDDAYRAALVFAAATAMVEYMKANNPPADVRVALLGDGVMLMDDSVAKHTIPPGRPGTLFQMIADAVNAGVKIHCWDTCMTARGVDVKDLPSKKAVQMTRLQFADQCFKAKHIVSF